MSLTSHSEPIFDVTLPESRMDYKSQPLLLSIPNHGAIFIARVRIIIYT